MKQGRKGMFKKDSYTEKAYKRLKQICDERICDRYKENTENAYSRMEWELSCIRKQGSAPLFMVAFDALTSLGASPEDNCPMGALAASLVSYLLGFSNIDPLDSVPCIYPEFCYGLMGERTPSIELCVLPEIYRGLVRYFDDYDNELRIRYRHEDDGKLFGIRIEDPDAKGEIDDYDLRFSFYPISSRKRLRKSLYRGESFEIIHPQTYEERVKCLGLSHNAEWTWDENAKLLYLSGDVPLNLLIAHREDVFEYMMEHGVGKPFSFRIAEYVRKGGPLRKGWESDMLEAMQKARIPQWYIESCMKINYLFPRAHDMVFLKNYG